MSTLDPLLVAVALLVAALLLLWLRLDLINQRAERQQVEALLKQARADLAALRAETARLQLNVLEVRTESQQLAQALRIDPRGTA